MADKLQIYQGAARLLGQQRVVALTDTGETRRTFDDAWTPAGNYLLAKGLWNFALKVAEIAGASTTRPGFQYRFAKPADWVRTANICQHPTMEEGLGRFEDEPGYWYADVDPLYVRYVSSHVDYGWKVDAWRQPFAKAFEAYLAFESGLPITNDKSNRNDLFTLFEKRLAEAKSLDAVDERVRQMPPGKMVRARLARNTSSQRQY